MMPWYRMIATHGPGSHSSEEEYIYSEDPLDESDRREMWDSWVTGQFWDYARGDVEEVTVLPIHVKEGLILEWADKARRADRVLKALEIVSDEPCAHERTYRLPQKYSVCTNCSALPTVRVRCRECNEVLVDNLCQDCEAFATAA